MKCSISYFVYISLPKTRFNYDLRFIPAIIHCLIIEILNRTFYVKGFHSENGVCFYTSALPPWAELNPCDGGPPPSHGA